MPFTIENTRAILRPGRQSDGRQQHRSRKWRRIDLNFELIRYVLIPNKFAGSAERQCCHTTDYAEGPNQPAANLPLVEEPGSEIHANQHRHLADRSYMADRG